MKHYTPKLPLKLTSRRVMLHVPEMSHAKAIYEYAIRNAEHLAPWAPTYPRGYFTLPFWKLRVKEWRRDFLAGRGVRFIVIPRGEKIVVGEIGLNSIVRGYFQACYLGFALDREYVGKGVMFEAVQRATRFAFDDLKLHRIMANHLPDNLRSGSLLQRLGFKREGIAEDYLAIAGNWRTHVLTSLTNKKLKQPVYW